LTLGFDSDCAHAGADKPAQQAKRKASNRLEKGVRESLYVLFIFISLGC